MRRSFLLSILFAVLCLSLTAGTGYAEDAHGDSHGSSGGVPGLIPSRDLALWSLITFGVFLAVLWKFAWNPLQDALQQRETKIKGDLAAAESERLKAEQLLKDYDLRLAKVQDEVREILAEARRDADTTRHEIIAAAQQEAEATRRRAVEEIQRSKDLAISELFEFVSANVIGAAEHVLKRSLKTEDHDRLVREALSELNVRRN